MAIDCAVAILPSDIWVYGPNPLSAADECLRRCIPLLQCLTHTNTWWTQNLSNLLGDELLPCFSLEAGVMLHGHEVPFTMKIVSSAFNIKSRDHATIRFVSETPVQLSNEFYTMIENEDAEGQYLAFLRLWRSWCAQIGFAALQKALSRRMLKRASRLDRLKLLVCLVTLLKTVNRHKTGTLDGLVKYFGFLEGTEFAPSSDKEIRSKCDQLHKITTYYIRHLTHQCFTEESPIRTCFISTSSGMFINNSIFSVIDEEIGQILRTEPSTKTATTKIMEKQTAVPKKSPSVSKVIFDKPTAEVSGFRSSIRKRIERHDMQWSDGKDLFSFFWILRPQRMSGAHTYPWTPSWF